ncbi:MAG: excinuclease ABC subunit UvrA [Acidobacteriota bacterium]
MAVSSIIIKGAAQHNLKHLDLEIPKNRLVVITGLSGSGKSSLAFDTIYAEGQRRYVDSLSAYARQFLDQMEKPDVEHIEGLSPAIAIEQKTVSRNPRSTVGTVTEVHDYLRVLFARVGVPHCPRCGRRIASQTPPQIVDQILELPAGTRLLVLAPLVRGRKGEHRRAFEELARRGFVRARVDGAVREIEPGLALEKNLKHTIEAVVDRVIAKPEARARLGEAVELALKMGDGLVAVSSEGREDRVFSERLACWRCGVSLPELAPRMFSFNSPYGACRECDGLGERPEFDPVRLVPDPSLSIADGAVVAWGYREESMEALRSALGRPRFDLETPFEKLPEALRHALLHGTEAVPPHLQKPAWMQRWSFQGIIPQLEGWYRSSASQGVRETLEAYMRHRACPACGGNRLRPESLSVRVAGRNLAEYSRLSIRDARETFSGLELGPQEETIARPILKQVTERLGFMLSVGLGYLNLHRAAATLSGGEGQRIRLATQIGSRLSGVLYVLDEPSIGLHARDHRKLLDTLLEMRDLGNSVLVVEHDEQTIRSADHVIDLGPGAGEQGGYLVAQGTPAEIAAHPDSLTGAYLSGRRTIPMPESRRRARTQLVLRGAAEHNLRDIDVAFPLGAFTAVTGVSGSGKSTLVNEILHPALMRRLFRSSGEPGRCRGLEGAEAVDKVIALDQSPIGRTPRSNPATYTGLFAPIRDLFSRVPEARARGYGAGRFSFNVKGGRCEACQGDGTLRIEMHLLPDVFVTCEECGGSRYNRDTLEVRYKGKTIAEVLGLSVAQALAFFSSVPSIRRKLETLQAVGLGYVRLGQSATTLSGGEAQRVKLSRELSRRDTGRTLYLLDEPTTGLHFEDVRRLLGVLQRLVDAGNTVIVIEHNLDVIKSADYLIDLGPEGGDEGGRIVASGTPEEVARVPESWTGRILRQVLEQEARRKHRVPRDAPAEQNGPGPRAGRPRRRASSGGR